MLKTKIKNSFIRALGLPLARLGGKTQGITQRNINKQIMSVNKMHFTVGESRDKNIMNKENKNQIHHEVSIPYYCNIFILAQILKKDMLDLVKEFNATLSTDVIDPMEYLNKDDLELFLMENNINYKIRPYESKMMKRPLIVTIMGHVDHGKTTLLDTFRNSKLVDKEFGKITQTIGAFNFLLKDETKITFIDTPGHEAFSKMRQRGAKVTDCIILVISGIESVQKQTVEVINIAKAAKIPMIIAINKIDRDQADTNKVFQDLQLYGVKVEQLGGNVPAVEISAKNNINIDLLERELSKMDNTYNIKEETNINAQAFIVESKSQVSAKFVNPCASAIVKKGVLKEGDMFICGEESYGKIKSLKNDLGETVKEALPGTAVEMIGFKSTPLSGNILTVMDSMTTIETLIKERKRLKEYVEAKQKEFINKGVKLGKLKRKERWRLMRKGDKEYLKIKMDQVFASGKEQQVDEKMAREIYLRDEVKKKKIIIRADTIGMLESIEDELLRVFEESLLDEYILQSSVEQITEEDFKTAMSSSAVLFLFNIDQEVEGFADIYKVGVRKHKLIYNIVEELVNFIKLSEIYTNPEFDMEKNDLLKGRAEIKQSFQIKHNNKPCVIAGCQVEEGKITASANYRLVSEKKVVTTGLKINSLKQNSVNISAIKQEEECGIIFENYNDFQEGDYIDAYDTNPKYSQILNTKGVVTCY